MPFYKLNYVISIYMYMYENITDLLNKTDTWCRVCSLSLLR